MLLLVHDSPLSRSHSSRYRLTCKAVDNAASAARSCLTTQVTIYSVGTGFGVTYTSALSPMTVCNRCHTRTAQTVESVVLTAEHVGSLSQMEPLENDSLSTRCPPTKHTFLDSVRTCVVFMYQEAYSMLAEVKP